MNTLYERLATLEAENERLKDEAEDCINDHPYEGTVHKKTD